MPGDSASFGAGVLDEDLDRPGDVAGLVVVGGLVLGPSRRASGGARGRRVVVASPWTASRSGRRTTRRNRRRPWRAAPSCRTAGRSPRRGLPSGDPASSARSAPAAGSLIARRSIPSSTIASGHSLIGGRPGRRLVAPGLPPALALQVVVARPAIEPGVVGPVQARDGRIPRRPWSRRPAASSRSSSATAAPTIASLVCSFSPSLKPAACRIGSGGFSERSHQWRGMMSLKVATSMLGQGRVPGGVHVVGDDLALRGVADVAREALVGLLDRASRRSINPELGPVLGGLLAERGVWSAAPTSRRTARGNSRSSPPRWG